jgi:long-chain acyl-CoA synthetase
VDRSGYLYITGRMKELIVTAGGDNILPVPIEQKLLVRCFASSCLVVNIIILILLIWQYF